MMTQQERLDYLVDELGQELEFDKSIEYSNKEKEQLLRSLMNQRMPSPVSPQFLEVQDAYLSQKASEQGIVEWQGIPTISEIGGSHIPYSDKLSIWQGDITRFKIDAIVNAANSQLLGCFVPCHGCIDNAIHSAAGIQLRAACQKLMNEQGHAEPTGKAKITAGYNLPAKHVIHTVGPIVYQKVTAELEQDLRNCYHSCLSIAVTNGVRTVAFCCISTGEFRFPNDLAARIAVNTVSDFLKVYSSRFDRIVFNVFKDVDLLLYQKRLGVSE